MPIPPYILALLTEACFNKLESAYMRWLEKIRPNSGKHYSLYADDRERNLKVYAQMMARRYWRMATKGQGHD